MPDSDTRTPPCPPFIRGGAGRAAMIAGAMALALSAGPGFADVKQVKLGVKGAT